MARPGLVSLGEVEAAPASSLPLIWQPQLQVAAPIATVRAIRQSAPLATWEDEGGTTSS